MEMFFISDDKIAVNRFWILRRDGFIGSRRLRSKVKIKRDGIPAA
jgi:hypothetical protein